jgi:lysophospholipid acyltransferase (LPLAT)-like uncharacterized protein
MEAFALKLRKPWMIKLAAWLISGIARFWMRTLSCRCDSQGQLIEPWNPRLKEHFIYAFWHDTLLCIPRVRTCLPAAGLVSQSRDGELLAEIATYFGVSTIRGSSTRGGEEAVAEAVEAAKRGHLAVAPDGPKGPRHQAKRGVIYLASWTGLRIVPLGVGFTAAWRVGSWDRMAVPKPGSGLTLVAGPVISVPPGIHKVETEGYRRLLEETLIRANKTAQEWADTGRRPQVQWPQMPARAA